MMIKITPLDTLFFRDGKPFGWGEETWADGIFPPHPSTLYGAMRSAYISHKGGLSEFNNEKMKNTIGTPSEKGSFKIKGIYLKWSNNVLFPLPLDLVSDKDSYDKNKVYIMKQHKSKELFVSNISLNNFLFPENIDNAEIPEGSFISDSSLKEYLNKEKNDFSIYTKNEFIISEPKVGIKRKNTTHTTEEGHLYRIGMNRLAEIHKSGKINEVSILVDFEGLGNFPENCIIKLGGDCKSAISEKYLDFKIPELSVTIKEINETRKFKIYFATPSIFENGWLPKSIDINTMEYHKNGLKLKLIIAAVGKPVQIGGWDLEKNSPKHMRKAIPVGSVYYFNIIKGEIEEIINNFHYKNISDYLPEEGYGLSFVGAV